MIDQSICMGCYLNPNWCVPQYSPFGFSKPLDLLKQDLQIISLTEAEKTVLQKLGETWNLFCSLDNRLNDDNKEFLDCIHRAQQIIAMRVARRVDPEVWRQSDEKSV